MMARKMQDVDTAEELVETSLPADADLRGRVRIVYESVDLTLPKVR